MQERRGEERQGSISFIQEPRSNTARHLHGRASRVSVHSKAAAAAGVMWLRGRGEGGCMHGGDGKTGTLERVLDIPFGGDWNEDTGNDWDEERLERRRHWKDAGNTFWKTEMTGTRIRLERG